MFLPRDICGKITRLCDITVWFKIHVRTSFYLECQVRKVNVGKAVRLKI